MTDPNIWLPARILIPILAHLSNLSSSKIEHLNLLQIMNLNKTPKIISQQRLYQSEIKWNRFINPILVIRVITDKNYVVVFLVAEGVQIRLNLVNLTWKRVSSLCFTECSVWKHSITDFLFRATGCIYKFGRKLAPNIFNFYSALSASFIAQKLWVCFWKFIGTSH